MKKERMPRDKAFRVRVTQEEYDRLVSMYKKTSDKNFSVFLRRMISSKVVPIANVQSDPKTVIALNEAGIQLERVIRALNKIGVNINQVAKVVNSFQQMKDHEYNSLMSQMSRIDDEREELRRVVEHINTAIIKAKMSK